MQITVALIIATITLVLGQITKITPIPNKFIPLQNVIIATLASIICIIFKVENMDILESCITCIFATMSAGGIADIKKITNKEI